MTSTAANGEKVSKKFSSSYDLLTPLPYGSAQRARAWSPVRFDGKTPKREESAAGETRKQRTEHGKGSHESRENLPLNYSTKNVHWRVTKSLSLPRDKGPPATIPLAVVAPMNSSRNLVKQTPSNDSVKQSPSNDSKTSVSNVRKVRNDSKIAPKDSNAAKVAVNDVKIPGSHSKSSRTEPKVSPTEPKETRILSKASRTDCKISCNDSKDSKSVSKASRIDSKDSRIESKATRTDAKSKSDSKDCKIDSKCSKIDLKGPRTNIKDGRIDSKGSRTTTKDSKNDSKPRNGAKDLQIASKSSKIDSKLLSKNLNENKLHLKTETSCAEKNGIKSDNGTPSTIKEHGKSSIKNATDILSKALKKRGGNVNPVVDIVALNTVPDSKIVRKCKSELNVNVFHGGTYRQLCDSSDHLYRSTERLQGKVSPCRGDTFAPQVQVKSAHLQDQKVHVGQVGQNIHESHSQNAVVNHETRPQHIANVNTTNNILGQKNDARRTSTLEERQTNAIVGTRLVQSTNNDSTSNVTPKQSQSITSSMAEGQVVDKIQANEFGINYEHGKETQQDDHQIEQQQRNLSDQPSTPISKSESGMKTNVIEEVHESPIEDRVDIQSVHGGQGRGVVGGGLMDDGRFNSPISSPQPIRFHSPLDVIESARKSQSLPGFYKRPTSPTPPPQNFREAFASSYRSTPPSPPLPHQENKDTPSILDHVQKKDESIPYKSSDGDKKSKKFLGGIFRRRRKESSFSSESESKSESDEPKRNFFNRRGKKRESQSKPVVKTEQRKKNDPEQCVETVATRDSATPRVYNHQDSYLITTDTGKIIKMSPTGSLGREVGSACKFEGQSLGIPRTYHSLNLGRPGVSASHDSLAESAYGSINSSMRSSGLGRSSSTDTLSRKEKKEALKARVERLRERTRGSSSDEDLASGSSSLFGSESSLNRSDSIQFHRSRSSRTERYIRRKSQELETLKVETEKDRRNREAVQARILEIQKSQNGSKKKMSKENLDLLQLYEKPKWNSQPENQEANYYGSEMFLSGSQAPFRHQYIIKSLSEAPCSPQPMSLDSQILPRNIPPKSFYNMHSNQRSVSYENHINKASSLPPQTVYIPLLPNYSLTPPVPPPRDRSSMLSPYDRNRPLSYSFENLNQDPLQRRTPQPPAASAVPPKMRNTPLQLPPASPCRRSFSERHLNDAGMNYSSLPGRPVPPSSPGLPGIPARPTIQKTPTLQGPINAQLTLSNVSFSCNHAPASCNHAPASCNHAPASYQGFAEVSQFEEKIAQNKLLAVPNMPPSPSSDYSSYVSDNSVRIQQGPSFIQDGMVEGQFEMSNSGLRFPRMDLSDVFKARSELGRTRSLPLPENDTSAGTQFLMGSPAVTRSSVVTQSKDDRGDNSDSSSRSSTMEQQLKSPQNRPLSIVTEKSESGETPPLTPGKILQTTTLEQSSSLTPGQKLHPFGQSFNLNPGQKPQPPKRNSSSIATYSRERFKQHLESVKIKESESKNLDVDQKFREFFLKEKERLERSKCVNFEEALQELEAIYKSLNLNSEDILEGAERWEASGSCVNHDDFGSPRAPLHTRPTSPDKTLDDLHYRRVQANNRNQPDTKSMLQMTGSYMLVSPVLGPPSFDAGLSPTSDATSGKEPDIIGDDVIVRNVQRANSVKVVDPQPPFGIPLGPVTQGPRTDYLSAPQPPQLSRHNSLPNAEPDIVSDDVAFRALRKDGGREIDILMSDLRLSNISRSKSVPRTVCATPQKKSETQTPRKLKHHQRAKREGKFVDFFKEALTDGEGGPLTPLSWRQCPSWVERANLSDNKWGSFNTSRDIQAELASLRALSQPDIRQTVISESRNPSGQPGGDSDHIDKIPFEFVYPPEPNALSSAPQLAKVRSASCIPAYSKSQCRPFDPNLNTSPKPFYLNAPSNSGNKTTLVNVDKLDHLIATLSLKPNQGNAPIIAVSSIAQDASNSEAPSNEAELVLPSIKDAKEKIQNAILDSMSNSSEDIIESEKRATPSKAKRGSPRPVGASSASAQDKEKESEKRKRRLEYERQRLRQERKRTPEGEEKERKKKKEEKGRDSQTNVFHRDRIKERRSPGKRGGTPPADGGRDLLRGTKSSGDTPLQKEKQKPALRDSEGDSEYHDAEDKNDYEGETFVDPSTRIHLKEGSNNFTMVQERQGGNHQDKPSLLKPIRTTPVCTEKPSPLKPIRTTPISGDEKVEQEKRDRIQRYKEERRKQMASRYGTNETSSSEEENGLPSSGSTYKRRRRPRSGLGSSADLQNIDGRRSHVSESSSNSRKKTKEGAEVQEGSPFSGASTNAAPRTTTLNNNENHAAQDESQPAFGRDPSTEPSTQHSPPQEGRADSADSTVSGSEGRLGGRRRASGDEKDKSHKRKSHLNRASTSEEAVYPPAPLSHLSDSNEEIPRRRRRRTPQGASESPYNSSPSNTTPDATLRLTPPSLTPSALSSSDLPGYSHSAIKSQQGNLPPITPYIPLRGSSYSSSTVNSTPSTDLYFRNDLRDSDKEKVESSKTSNLKGTPIKFTPTKFSHLRKPEIPDVLRPKEQTSPGVVINSSNSRPSSVVVEKPPVGPEGGTGVGAGVRISGLRSSLRKGNDSGTCFMASRRERRDEEDLTHRNGDESPDQESGEDVGQHLDNLTVQALHLKSRADNLSGENMVLECEQYLQVNKTFPPTSRSPSSPPRDTRCEENEGTPPQTANITSLRSKAPISIDSGQKNWHGGSEGSSEQVIRRLAFEEKVRERPSSSAVPSGPPYSLDNGVIPRKNSVTSRRDEEFSERTSQGILKKASWDLSEGGDPRPILKKKISMEEDPSLSDPRKSILKKKSLTDDELDWERPRSILKGARSREDLMDRSESVPSPPTPILKRGSKDHSEGECGELRPILKRRETTDGVRSLIGSTLVRRDSAPLPTLQPSHGILKKRPSSPSLELKRPTSPSLDLLTSGERSLSVAERVAGMEAVQIGGGIEPVGGAKPKIRSRPSSRERPSSPSFFEREVRRSSWVPPSNHMMGLSDEGRRSPARALSPMFGQNTSRVSQKAAFFSQLEQEKSSGSSGSPPSFQIKKERGTRFATQPITEGEVSKAAQMFDSPSGRRSPRESQRSSEAVSKPVAYVSPETLVLRRTSGDGTINLPRRMSAQELRFEDAHGQEVVKGILKSDPVREKSKDSPRSILKMDSRKSSSEGEYPKGILKSESPLSSNKGSPEHEVRSLRSVLKKDSSSEDPREIKSILKPESQSLEPEISSDSSSELTAQELNSSYSASDTIVQTVNHNLISSYTSNNQAITSPAGDLEYFPRRSSSVNQQVLEEAVKQALPMKAKDNLAEALRQIEPIRDKSREREKEKEDERTITKEDVISNIREKAVKKVEEREGIFLSSLPRRPEGVNGRTKEDEDDLEINEIEAYFEESVKSLSDLGQEVKVPKERVTYRHKTRQQNILEHKDRWTLNDFSPCGKMDTSPVSPPSSDTSSGTASSSPVDLLGSPAFESKSAETFLATSFSSSATLEREVTTTSTDPLRAVPSGSSSINARLLSLQKNGEEGWRSRVQKDDEPLLSPQLPRAKPRPTSLLERVSKLETSSQQWRDRVSQSDATKFTVAHKMASASSVPSLMVSEEKRASSVMTASVTSSSSSSSTFISSSEVLSPASERKKRTPQPKVFKSKTGSCIPELLTKEGVRKEVRDASRDFARSISIPSETSKDQEDESSTKVVAIPRPDDDHFDSFFASASVAKEANENIKVDTTDFDIITSNTSTLAVQRREVRVTRKNQTRRNPLRSLALREDLKDEYTQIEIGAGERELRRMKVEELSKSSSLAMEALAGLASKENFSAVALRRVDDTPVSRELAPYSELMLLLVKGRRHPQVRLVKPRWDSVNQGDDFLLITPIELFHYKGRYSNVIERAVASEMALYILQTKDMGVTSALKVTDIEEGSPLGKKERFWKKLGGTSESQGVDPGPPEADDHIEAALIASNKVFEVKDQALVPVNGAWGQCLKYELLSSDKVLVFDFGSEVYLWAGKRASMEEKRKGTVLVKELWKENYDYSDCDVNPVFPPVNPGETKTMDGPRPEWGICGKITENVETILFKEKFVDWPDTAQQSWIKEVLQEGDQKVEPVCDLEPCDVTEMLNTQPEEPDLVLEMSHLGRGVLYYDEEERRMHNISTNDIHVWHISENEKKELAGRTSSQFFSGEAYVVRWYYHVTATGRTLKGAPSRHNVTGRSRVAYFFWQGKNSSLSDKGVSALMTVELDEERGPHVRVTMGHEPPAFLGLFKGGLVIHEGKRDKITKATAKLFVVRGEMPSEAHLIEYDVSPAHLRSRGCVVMANLVSGVLHLWVGAKATSHSKEVGLTAAKLVCDSPPEEMGWQTRLFSATLREEEEGRESEEFQKLFNNEPRLNRHYFFVAKDVCSSYDWTTRVWKLEAGSGLFQASELSSSYRAMDRVCPFPVWQEELFSTQQPALFLIDAGAKIYLWQGWVPEQTSDEDASASVTGSAFLRFTFARRAALQTAVFYSRKKEELVKNGTLRNGTLSLSDCSVLLSPRLVISGMESLEFTNLFPVWKPREDVAEIQEKEGRWKHGKEYCAIDVLSQLSKERYTLEELQLRPLPDGVDPSRLEKYLSDQEFKDTLGVSKREFLALPSWKQLQLKKKGNLF